MVDTCFFGERFLRLKLFDRQYVFRIFCPARSSSKLSLRKIACFMAQQTNLSLGFRVRKNRGGGHLFFLASILSVSNYLIAKVLLIQLPFKILFQNWSAQISTSHGRKIHFEFRV